MKKFTYSGSNSIISIKIGLFSLIFLITFIFVNQKSNAQSVTSSAQSFASYAIDKNGNLFTWGNDQYLQPISSSTILQDSTPVMVAMPTGVTKWITAAGGQNYSIALGNDGNIYSWGLNNYGQLGNGTNDNDSNLVLVNKPTGVTSWKAISAGAFFNLAIGNDGNVYAWGYNNFGQLGNGTTTNANTPGLVNLPSGVTATKISAAANSSMAAGSDGNLYVWGRNVNGQLGLGNTTDQHSPVTTTLPTGVTVQYLASGAFTNSILGSDGNIYGAGSNANGQIGDGTTTQRTTFKLANKPNNVTSWDTLVCGASFTLAVGNNDTLYAWGFGGTGEMGNGIINKNNTSAIAVNLPAGINPISIAAGHNHGLAMGNDFKVYAWGKNTEGELGLNDTSSAVTLPDTVTGVSGTGYLLLPVELTSFTASVSSNGVLLNWKTATENNNSGFEVQRSVDSKTYTTIDFVKGNGSSARINEYSYLDKNVSGNVYYRLNQVDYNGTSKYSQTIEVNAVQPIAYSLDQNYPNPFNPATVIKYSVPKSGFVSLKVYNILGQEAATLQAGFQKAGSYKVKFDASKLSSGVYLYRLESSGSTLTKKMILMK